MWGEIIVGALAMVGTLGGAFLANRKSAALLAYRLQQLEDKTMDYLAAYTWGKELLEKLAKAMQ